MAKRAGRRRWTVMVYLAGDNNLDSAGVTDLGEMKTVGSSDSLAVVAQFDRSGRSRVTNRYYLRKGTALADDVVQRLGETNTGDPRVLTNFVQWAARTYPADRYCLVIWNHGAGVDDSNLYGGDYFGGQPPPVSRKGTVVPGRTRSLSKPVRMSTVEAALKRARRALFAPTVESMVKTRAIAFDDEAKDFLDNVELKRVLKAARKTLKKDLDILGFDACLMSMVEIAWQLRGMVSLTCGSEEEEPGEGWPYDSILRAVARNPAIAPKALAAAIVRSYAASYGKNDGVTLSATDVGAVKPLVGAVSALGTALTKALGDPSKRAAILAIRAQVQEYTAPYDQYCDLGDLCALLGQFVRDAAVTAARQRVLTALKGAVLANAAKGKSVANSHGLSIYFPKKRVSTLYSDLDFTKRNGWVGFIKAYTAAANRRR